jgi:lysophospholipase L1-like esterase
MSTDRVRRIRTLLLKLACFIAIAMIGLAVLEGGARLLGLGQPVLYYNDAWGGMRPLPSQRVSRLNGATITIDANGYRTPVAEKPGAWRVLYLGDSVTWGGSSIDDAQLFTEVAADVLRGQGRAVYAMNAGVNATALINHAEIFQDYRDKLDILVWLFPWGDTERTYATAGFLWPARHKPRFALVEAIDLVILKCWLDRPLFRKVPAAKEVFVTPDAPAGHQRLFETVLAERKERNLDAVRSVVADARGRGVPIVLGVTPYRKSAELEALPAEATSFLEEMTAAGATVFDVSAALEAAGGLENCYLDRAHFAAEGHRRVGQALGETLHAVLQEKPTAP